MLLSVVVIILLSGSMLVGYFSSTAGAEGVDEFWLILPYHITCIALSFIVFIAMLVLRKKQLPHHFMSNILSIVQICSIMLLFLISAHAEIQVLGIKNINTFIIVMFALGLLLRFSIRMTLLLQAGFTAVIVIFLIAEKHDISNFYPSIVNIICAYVISSLSSFTYWSTRKKHFLLTKSLEFLATSDPLTRLHNRRSFDVYFEREWQRAMDENLYITLFFIDVDNFKKYNDLYGHLQGDKCLCTIADTLASAVRKNDFAARYGGEEFVVSVSGDNTDVAHRIADEMLDTLRKKNIPHGDSVAHHVTMSIGCMIHRPGKTDGISMQSFIRMADEALYMAKEQGRNRIVFHPESAK